MVVALVTNDPVEDALRGALATLDALTMLMLCVMDDEGVDEMSPEAKKETDD